VTTRHQRCVTRRIHTDGAAAVVTIIAIAAAAATAAAALYSRCSRRWRRRMVNEAHPGKELCKQGV
jgi:hypothetical protein